MSTCIYNRLNLLEAEEAEEALSSASSFKVFTAVRDDGSSSCFIFVNK